MSVAYKENGVLNESLLVKGDTWTNKDGVWKCVGIDIAGDPVYERAEMNPQEALYAFMGWLTTREEVVYIGSKEECSSIPKLIKEFSERNNLADVSDNYPDNITFVGGA